MLMAVTTRQTTRTYKCASALDLLCRHCRLPKQTARILNIAADRFRSHTYG